MKKNRQLYNGWIVPHNIYLCTKYDAHINIEVCTSISAVKYIYKYVYKGHDRAIVSLNNAQPSTPSITVQRDEISTFLDARYVSAPEACWTLFGFLMHKKFPAHIRLAIHLPGEERVRFHKDTSVEELLQHADSVTTTLLQWFKCNSEDQNARQFLYHQFPNYYVWLKKHLK